ncbi:MAG TPA: S1/P1 nuclease, partial [Chitinophagaceae bacterium]
QLRQWQKQPLSEWLFESYQISQQLYNELDKPEPRLSYRYNFDHIQTVNDRLLKGGVRLAGLLNEIFNK